MGTSDFDMRVLFGFTVQALQKHTWVGSFIHSSLCGIVCSAVFVSSHKCIKPISSCLLSMSLAWIAAARRCSWCDAEVSGEWKQVRRTPSPLEDEILIEDTNEDTNEDLEER